MDIGRFAVRRIDTPYYVLINNYVNDSSSQQLVAKFVKEPDYAYSNYTSENMYGYLRITHICALFLIQPER